MRPIVCGRTLRKKLEAKEVPAVIPPNFAAVDTTGKPDATPAAPAAVETPNELAAQDFAAWPNCFHVCPLLGPTTVPDAIPEHPNRKPKRAVQLASLMPWIVAGFQLGTP